MRRVACVDLFCGAGGLTHGLLSEGIPVVAGVDVDEACRYPFETNNGARFITKDVSELTTQNLVELFGPSEIRILAGCAPCQPFSTYAQRYDNKASPRRDLLYQFARLIESTLPHVVTMENVPMVTNYQVFDDFVDTLLRLGYHDPWFASVDCVDYGLPQQRNRLVLLASRLQPIELLSPTHDQPVTVREKIGSLPALAAGESSLMDRLHTAATLSDLNLKRIRASSPGGSWRDWPKRLIAECHLRDSGRTYPGVYGRMEWDQPAPTLTTQFFGFGNGRFGHPEQDRAISLREGAILQGFPKKYAFVPKGEPIYFRILGRMIGNAVPVTLGKIIGRSITKHLGITPKKKTHPRTATESKGTAASNDRSEPLFD